MARELSQAEQHEELLREAREMYRESFVLAFATLTEGWPELMRKRLLRFFTRETSPAYWLKLREADDVARAEIAKREAAGELPPGSAAAFVGQADSQLRQFEVLEASAT